MQQFPNRFEEATRQFVLAMKNRPFPYSENTWGDISWVGKINFSRYGAKMCWSKNIQPSDFLPSDQADVLRAYCVHLNIDKNSKLSRIIKVASAIKVLFHCLEAEGTPVYALHQQIYERTLTEIGGHYINRTRQNYVQIINSFITYMRSRNCISSGVRTHQPFKSVNTSTVLAAAQQGKKMPDEKAILATGHIFSQVMPPKGEQVDYLEKAMDRMICCQLALSLAAPERIGEIQLLAKQGLTEQITDKDGQSESFYFLQWCGSKGMHDFPKFIHQTMVPTIERVLSYLAIACEPARILARYYENPRATLNNLLGNYVVEDLHGLSLKGTVNIWQLGGLLGFYEEISETSPLHRITGFPFTCNENQVIGSIKTKCALLGSNFDRATCPGSLTGDELTLAKFEQAWIEWVKDNIKSFPYRKHENGKKIKLANALLVYTGKQLVSNKSGYKLGRSYFAIESFSLKQAFARRLNESSSTASIFRRFGFESEIYQLTSHQFRHYLNTQAQRGGMAEVVLAAWSGRASVAQNVVYDHRTDDEKHAAIVEVCQQEADSTIIILPVDDNEFKLKTGKAATKMTTGFCIQSLHINPCTRLNACVGCTKSCHIKGDEQALALIKADLRVQESRLAEVSTHLTEHNKIANDWFRLHSIKANQYRALIEVMDDPNVEEGAVIVFTGDKNTLNITNSDVTQSVEYKPLLANDNDKNENQQPAIATPENDDPLAALNALVDSMAPNDLDSSEQTAMTNIQQYLEG